MGIKEQANTNISIKIDLNEIFRQLGWSSQESKECKEPETRPELVFRSFLVP